MTDKETADALRAALETVVCLMNEAEKADIWCTFSIERRGQTWALVKLDITKKLSSGIEPWGIEP